jgi:transcriptional regulator with XRE-family HTH domain
MITREEMTDLIRKAADEAKTQRALARQWGVSPSYITDLLQGLRDPGPAILDAMGYERVIFYRKKKGEKQ